MKPTQANPILKVVMKLIAEMLIWIYQNKNNEEILFSFAGWWHG